MLAAAKKGARVADKLIDEFGDDQLKRKKNTGKKVASIISGSGADGYSPPKKSSKHAAPAAAAKNALTEGRGTLVKTKKIPIETKTPLKMPSAACPRWREMQAGDMPVCAVLCRPQGFSSR